MNQLYLIHDARRTMEWANKFHGPCAAQRSRSLKRMQEAGTAIILYTMRVLESLCRSKSGHCDSLENEHQQGAVDGDPSESSSKRRKNEDMIVITSDYACVIDGASSVSNEPRRWTSKHLSSGRWASEIIHAAILKEQALLDEYQRQQDDEGTTDQLRVEQKESQQVKSVRLSTPHHFTASHLVDRITTTFQEAYREEGGEDLLNYMLYSPLATRPTASMVLYSKPLQALIFVGDCQAAVGVPTTAAGQLGEGVEGFEGTTHGATSFSTNNVELDWKYYQYDKFVDTVTSNARCMLYLSKQLEDEHRRRRQQEQEALIGSQDSKAGIASGDHVTEDVGRHYIKPLLEGQRFFQNNPDAPVPYRYWVLDGTPFVSESRQTDSIQNQNDNDEHEGIRVVKIPDHAHEIIMASDGYPKLRPSLDESEAYLQYVLSQDPDMTFLHPSTKGLRKEDNYESFDDRTYLRIQLLDELGIRC